MNHNPLPRRILTYSSIVLVVLLIALWCIGEYFVDYALARKTPEELQEQFADTIEEYKNEMEDEHDINAEAVWRQMIYGVAPWYNQTPHQRWQQTAQDGITLVANAYMQPQATNQWVLCVHGYHEDKYAMLTYCRQLYALGYNLLIPDLRGQGESGGDYIGMGWLDRQDLLGWIDAIVQANPQAQIACYGVSMGASALLMMMDLPLPNAVYAIVSDSAYASVQMEFSALVRQMFSLPAFPFVNVASLVCKVRAGYTFAQADALAALKHNVTPIFFIHGGEDTFVPPEHAQLLYGACNAPKELWIVPPADHSRAMAYAYDEYWQRVHQFLLLHQPAAQ